MVSVRWHVKFVVIIQPGAMI